MRVRVCEGLGVSVSGSVFATILKHTLSVRDTDVKHKTMVTFAVLGTLVKNIYTCYRVFHKITGVTGCLIKKGDRRQYISLISLSLSPLAHFFDTETGLFPGMGDTYQRVF